MSISLQRLSVEAEQAAAGAEAAKQLVRSAKAELKRARKLSKTAKKVAKLARKKVEAAKAAAKAADHSMPLKASKRPVDHAKRPAPKRRPRAKDLPSASQVAKAVITRMAVSAGANGAKHSAMGTHFEDSEGTPAITPPADGPPARSGAIHSASADADA